MKLKDRILVTLLLTMGLVIHHITPGIFFGMKMDFLLISIVIAVILYPTFENYILVAILGGVFSALTTSFPGGQIPNIIDKFISTFVILLLTKNLLKNRNNIYIVGLIGLIGTFVSGSVFLLSVKYIMGISDLSSSLIYMVVLPASIINSFGTAFMYKVIEKSLSAYKTA